MSNSNPGARPTRFVGLGADYVRYCDVCARDVGAGGHCHIAELTPVTDDR